MVLGIYRLHNGRKAADRLHTYLTPSPPGMACDSDPRTCPIRQPATPGNKLRCFMVTGSSDLVEGKPTAPGQDNAAAAFDPMLSMPTPYDQQPTPGGASTSGSVHTDPDKDPFLSLLEQLAENEVSRGGPSELDFFLSGQSA